MNGLRLLKPRTIVLLAIVISLLAHFYLFFGFPAFLFSKAAALEDTVVAELKVEQVKKVQLSKPKALEPTVRDASSNAVGDGFMTESAGGEGQGGGEQEGQPFKVPESGVYYYDAYLDGQYLQTDGSGNLTWTTANTKQIFNGTSNVAIPVSDGNVLVGVSGNANIAVFSGTGVNVNGYLKIGRAHV